EQKIVNLTRALEDRFGVCVSSHRAGRWVIDERYAKLLVRCGYRVDCSVTPHIIHSTECRDYSGFPDVAYIVDLSNLALSGRSGLLEIPMTIAPNMHSQPWRWLARVLESTRAGNRVAARLFPGLLRF